MTKGMRLFVALIGVVLWSSVSAQYDIGGYSHSCPVGTQWDDPRCIRTPTKRTEIPLPPPPRPQGHWIETWGAVVSDTTNGIVGRASGHISQQSAEAAARNDCVEGGGSTCVVILTYRNQCIAFSSPYIGGQPAPGIIATVSAESEGKAKEVATKRCETDNGKTCGVLFTECSKPAFVNDGG